MPGNFKKDDLRVEKTLKAIRKTFFNFLERYSFGQITVNKLCEEAQISRRTFYLHFNDKYDLLKFCLTDIRTRFSLSIDDSIRLTHENEKIISNLLEDANKETLDLLYAFMLSFLDIGEQKDEDGKLNPWYIVLSNFCVGGMMKILSWQVDNKFPQDLQQVINTHSINLIIHIMTWKSDKNDSDGGKTSYYEL